MVRYLPPQRGANFCYVTVGTCKLAPLWGGRFLSPLGGKVSAVAVAEAVAEAVAGAGAVASAEAVAEAEAEAVA